MKSFKSFVLNEQALSDDEHVHRIDSAKISNFSSKMNTYHHTPDWTQSHQAEKGETPEKGHKTSTGVFAAHSHNVAPYAAPRETRFTHHYDEHGNSHITFHEKDKEKIQNHRPIVSSFPKNKFKHIEASGEHFSKDPGTPAKQNTIKNPVKFMQKHGHNVHFVPDLDKHKKDLERNNVEHNSEGF